MADPIAFGVERLLHDERTVVTARREHGALAAPLVLKRELRAPASNVDGIRKLHGSIIQRGVP